MTGVYVIYMGDEKVSTFYGELRGAFELLEQLRYADFCRVRDKFVMDYSEYVNKFAWTVKSDDNLSEFSAPTSSSCPVPRIDEMQFVEQLWRVGQNIIHINRSNGRDVPTANDWGDKQKLMARLMLVNTELAEAAEALRKNDRGNFEEELADVLIRLLDLAYGMDLDLAQTVLEKMVENSNRRYRHGGKLI